ncbi:cathepsin B [Pelomyxa schiedti]|nr:cathepsin B [Pelomyxa schiedti]
MKVVGVVVLAVWVSVFSHVAWARFRPRIEHQKEQVMGQWVMRQMEPREEGEDLMRRLTAPSSLPKRIDDSLPVNFDGREQWPGCIHGILDQADCGSCWAFASSEALSDRFCIWENVDVVLSPQYLLSCEFANLGCFCGSVASFAWDFLMREGITTIGCVPYVSGNGDVPSCRDFSSCEDGSPWTLYHALNFTHVGDFINADNHITEIMNALMQGPLDATFNVYADFHNYTSGVYRHLTGRYEGLHSVKVIGWGVENGTDYWLVQNSWGSDWGDHGYFKILKGSNECHFNCQSRFSVASALPMLVVMTASPNNHRGLRTAPGPLPVAPPVNNEPITQAQAAEIPPPPSTPPVHFHELPGNHRILVIGKSQVGKSTVINALINGSVLPQNMREPAEVGGEANNGTTDKVTAFYRDGHTLIDSIGFTDPRFTLYQISDSLHEVLFNHRLGLTGFIVVMKHDVLTPQEKGLLDMFANLFGNEIWANSILVITHYEGKGKPSPSAEEYIAMAHHQDYRTILRRFGTRIVVGSFATDCDDGIELVLRKRRQVMHDRIVSALDTLPPGRNVELKAGFLEHLKVFLLYLFNASSDVERVIQAFSDQGAPNIYFYNRTCAICQEDVTTDILVTQCGHLYHFDCLRVWIDSGYSTCHTCRREVLHQTRVQYPPVNDQGTLNRPTDEKT